MAHKATPTGAIRPISTATLIKRLRRHFAAQNEVFHVARTERERQQWGDYYVTAGDSNTVVDQLPYLDLAARRLGILRDDEALIVPEPAWRHFVARERAAMINGQRVTVRDRVTPDFPSEAQALQAAAPIVDRTNLVRVSYDATVREQEVRDDL